MNESVSHGPTKSSEDSVTSVISPRSKEIEQLLLQEGNQRQDRNGKVVPHMYDIDCDVDGEPSVADVYYTPSYDHVSVHIPGRFAVQRRIEDGMSATLVMEAVRQTIKDLAKEPPIDPPIQRRV